LKPYLKKIDAVKNAKDLEALLIEMEPLGGIGFFELILVLMRKTVIEM
jgi:endothelin-converting enzyme/putative endopeptidase